MKTKFFIAFEARCGSGMLIDLLNHQSGIYVEDEWMMFRRKDFNDHRSQANHVATFFLEQATHNNRDYVGFITKVSDMSNATEFICSLREADTKIVDLRRRNICKQALSNIRAVAAREKTGKAHAYNQSEVFGPSTIEPSRFWQSVSGFEARVRAQDTFVRSADLPTIGIYYEDIAADSPTFCALLRFLGAEQTTLDTSPSRTLKQTKDRIEEAILNFDEVLAAAPSDYHRQLLLS